MDRKEILEKVTAIIKDVLDEEDISITEETVASDVDGWDSLVHITLIGTVEDEFNIKFAMKDIVNMKNVGEMIDLIIKQLG